MVLIIIYFICTSNQSCMFQVKDMNVYIEPLIDKILKLQNVISMYDVSTTKEISIPCNGCMDNTRCP